MPRTRKGSARRRSHNRVLKDAKGFYGARSRQFRTAKPAVARAETYATRDRKQRKRTFRSLWITRLSAALRQRGVTYSRFINALKKAQIEIDRKMLAEIAISDSKAFDRILEAASVTS